jgi:hydroxymethylpyrimidine pyrophosphatase-like HAD family hydrolase
MSTGQPKPNSASHYEAVSFDYDGTLASNGVVAPGTVEALRRLVDARKRLLLVTGRRLDELLTIFSHCELFERVVAENGAVLYCPQTGERVALSDPPPARFVETLRSRGVTPLELGLVIVATREPQESVVLQVIRDLGLELQLIFNKGAVMVLPPNVNKASGLKRALKLMGLRPERVIAVGDAENDHAFLDYCGLGVAVGNALPAVKEHADLVMSGSNGAGILELTEQILSDRLKLATVAGAP